MKRGLNAILRASTSFGAAMLILCGRAPLPAAPALVPSADGATVYDTANNITWLADASLPASIRFGLPLCNGSGSGVQICVNATGSMNYQAAVAWVAAMNAAKYLGHGNWQLPTTPALDRNCGRTGPNGNSFGFGCTAGALDSIYNALGFKSPNTAVPISGNTAGPFSNLQPYLYWSQTSAGPTAGNATFSFSTGWQGANTLPNFLYLLPMIPGKLPGMPPATGNGLQVSPDKQTVYDPETDITWLANANLAATNAFGLPRCTDPTTPAICVAQDGAMTWASAEQFLANMNGSAYLGQTHWQAPPIDPNCPGYNCDGTRNPMGNLFYDQFGLTQGMSAVAVPDVATGPFHNLQPYLYWTCGGATIESPCQPDGAAPNFQWSYSFGSGFQGTDLLANNLWVTAYFVGPAAPASPPALTAGTVANGLTYIAGGLVPGSWAQVKGTNLSAASRTWASADFTGLGNNLPTKLSGTSVTVNGIPAAVSFVDPTQVNFQVPAGVTGTASVQVFNNGVASNTITGAVANSAPGIVPIPVNGVNYAGGVFLDGKITGDPSVYAGFRKARAGDQIQLFASGLVPEAAGVQVGFLSISGVSVTLGNVTFPADAAALVAPGEFQINFTVPQQFASLPAANYPVTIAVNGVSSPATINSAPPGPVVIPTQH